MRPVVYVVVILLIFSFLAVTWSLDYPQRESKHSSLSVREDFARKLKRPVTVKINRPVTTNGHSVKSKTSITKSALKSSKANKKLLKDSTTKNNKLAFIDLSLKSKTDAESRETRKRAKKRMGQAIMALLIAYKFKFATLIPTIVGLLILLKSTTALAGFFFALFAAVLGLKGHSY